MYATYLSLGLIANGTLENIDLYRHLGELLGQNRTKIELKIVSKLTCGNKNLRMQFLFESYNNFVRPGGGFTL